MYKRSDLKYPTKLDFSENAQFLCKSVRFLFSQNIPFIQEKRNNFRI